MTSRVENCAAEHVLFVSRGGEKFVVFQADERCGVSDFKDRLNAAMQSQPKNRKKNQVAALHKARLDFGLMACGG